MGIPLDASPVAIERKYNSLLQEYKKKMLEADHAASQELRKGLELRDRDAPNPLQIQHLQGGGEGMTQQDNVHL